MSITGQENRTIMNTDTKIVTAQVLRAAYVAGRFQEAITHAVELHANGSYQRVLCNRVRLENLTEAADESLTPTCRRCQRILTKKLTTTEKILLTPHQRIMRAAKHKTGIRFSADEVQTLALDDAISTRAQFDDDCEAGCGRKKLDREKTCGDEKCRSKIYELPV